MKKLVIMWLVVISITIGYMLAAFITEFKTIQKVNWDQWEKISEVEVKAGMAQFNLEVLKYDLGVE